MSSDTDPIAISSDAGTWVAAFFAVIAVVGLIAPWLALHAAYSDRNRALNAIRDVPQKYVTRGLQVSRRFYLFRRTHVPNLSPTYISNEPSLPVLISLPATSNIWTLSSTNYYGWNTGWAKLCELIQAYSVKDATSGTEIAVDIPPDGNLEIVDGLTALVVSKYWILLVGLLGRYGRRKDGGILQKSSIRRDMDGERASIRHWVTGDGERAKFRPPFRHWVTGDGERAKFGPPFRHWVTGESASEGSEDEGSRISSTQKSERSGIKKANVYRVQHGNWKFTTDPLPKLQGITGSIQVIGRLKGSWREFTSVSFSPHSMDEIMDPGVVSKVEVSPLRTLFWLAYGFMPHMYDSDAIISLEDPPDMLYRGPVLGQKPRRYFRLLEANYMPSSIGKAIRQLSLSVDRVMQFLEVPTTEVSSSEVSSMETSSASSSPKSEPLKDPPSSVRSKYSPSDSSGSVLDNISDQISLDGDWIIFTSNENFKRSSIHLFKDDVRKMITAFLCLNWDPWGYLVWRHNCTIWEGLLYRTQHLLGYMFDDDAASKVFGDIDGENPSLEGIDWKSQLELDASETEKLVRIEMKLSDGLSQPTTKALRIPLAALFIIDDSFQDYVHEIYDARKSSSISAVGGPSNETTEPQVETESSKNGPRIEFDFNTKELRCWNQDEDPKTWSVEVNVVNLDGNSGVVDIPPGDIILIGLWTVIRAFLWLHSSNSLFLIRFINDLDRHVYVV